MTAIDKAAVCAAKAFLGLNVQPCSSCGSYLGCCPVPFGAVAASRRLNVVKSREDEPALVEDRNRSALNSVAVTQFEPRLSAFRKTGETDVVEEIVVDMSTLENGKPVRESIPLAIRPADRAKVRFYGPDHSLQLYFVTDNSIQPEIEIIEQQPESLELLTRYLQLRLLLVLLLEELFAAETFPSYVLELLGAGMTFVEKAALPFKNDAAIGIAILLVENMVRSENSPEPMVR